MSENEQIISLLGQILTVLKAQGEGTPEQREHRALETEMMKIAKADFEQRARTMQNHAMSCKICAEALSEGRVAPPHVEVLFKKETGQ